MSVINESKLSSTEVIILIECSKPCLIYWAENIFACRTVPTAYNNDTVVNNLVKNTLVKRIQAYCTGTSTGKSRTITNG